MERRERLGVRGEGRVATVALRREAPRNRQVRQSAKMFGQLEEVIGRDGLEVEETRRRTDGRLGGAIRNLRVG